MATPTSASGYVDIPEGKLFWVLEQPPSGKDPMRPLLVFIHAIITDHLLWESQVSYFLARGWSILRYDLLGAGRSEPNEAFLKQPANSRPKIQHYDHLARILCHLSQSERFRGSPLFKSGTLPKVVVVGLSAGGSHAVDFALAYPSLAAGLVAVAGGLGGHSGVNNTAEEDELFAECDRLTDAKDVDGLAALLLRIWLDGPLQPDGRVKSASLREKMTTWLKDFAVRECQGRGGSTLRIKQLDPPAADRLKDLTIPTAVAIGKFDETWTVDAMRHLARDVPGATLTEFEAAHMVNLEEPDEFNAWLEHFFEPLK